MTPDTTIALARSLLTRLVADLDRAGGHIAATHGQVDATETAIRHIGHATRCLQIAGGWS